MSCGTQQYCPASHSSPAETVLRTARRSNPKNHLPKMCLMNTVFLSSRARFLLCLQSLGTVALPLASGSAEGIPDPDKIHRVCFLTGCKRTTRACTTSPLMHLLINSLESSHSSLLAKEVMGLPPGRETGRGKNRGTHPCICFTERPAWLPECS